MELLGERGAVWGTRDDWGWTVLHEVAASATRETVAWVCRESKGLNNLPDKLGRGPLLVGLMAGAEFGAVEEMIEYGENPAQEDEVSKLDFLELSNLKSRWAGDARRRRFSTVPLTLFASY